MKMILHRHSGLSIQRLLIALVWCGLLAARVSAVIIIEKGNREPICGYLVESNDVRVVIRQVLANGEVRERIMPRASIEEFLQAVSSETLAKLSRDKPEEYRNYAEELASKRADPDAQVTALRLYQIAAWLAPEKLGRSCLLGMAALARSPAEERKFRAMAFLLDSEHDRSMLKPSAIASASQPKPKPEDRAQIVALLRALRDGKYIEARALARRPALQDVMPQVVAQLGMASLNELKVGEPMPSLLLQNVLAMSIALDPAAQPTLEEQPVSTATGWSTASDSGSSTPAPLLTLEALTEFDPRACHFRNGTWSK